MPRSTPRVQLLKSCGVEAWVKLWLPLREKTKAETLYKNPLCGMKKTVESVKISSKGPTRLTF